MTAAIRRLVSGAIAFRSTRSRRSLSARASPAISAATDSATSGGTIDRSTDDSRTTASRSGRSSIRALSASSIVLALRLAAGPDDASAASQERVGNRASHRARADDPDGRHKERVYERSKA